MRFRPRHLAPNEFQVALTSGDACCCRKKSARVNKVKVPDNFALGFEEFTTALPNTKRRAAAWPATFAG